MSYELDSAFSGSLKAAANVASNTRPLVGIATLAVQVTGTFSATAVFEASFDNTNWYAIYGVPLGGGLPVTSTTATGEWFFGVGAYRYIRVRCSSYSSGTIVVNAYAASAPHYSTQDGVASYSGINPTNYAATTAADITTTGATQVKAAAGSGLRNYITAASVSNMHASVNTRVDITDGSGGTVLWSGPAASAGGGFTLSFPTPLMGSANTAVYAQCATSGAQVRVSIAGFTGA